MESDFFISASVVTYNDREEALAACRSLLEHTKKYPLKLYVIDNASADGTPDALERLDGVTVLRNEKNVGFGAAHNKVLNLPLGQIHFCVNPDILLSDDILSEMTDRLLADADTVMAMPRIFGADGREQFLPKEVPTFSRLFFGRLAPLGGVFRRIRDAYTWVGKDVSETCDIDFCSGCFFAIKSDVFRRLGGFDERFFMYLEDADLTLRAKKHGRVVLLPDLAVTHLWQRESAKKLKYLLIHTSSCFKFLSKKRRLKKP